MNIFVVTEGEIGERYVYEKWINYYNPKLTFVPRLFDIKNDNFSILSGNGYPQYMQIIRNAIEDINNHGDIDRFVIAIDSEDMSEAEKEAEILECVKNLQCNAKIFIVVQHFCLETWALANVKFYSTNTQDEALRQYRQHYDTKTLDPAGLTKIAGFEKTKSVFAYRYFKLLALEKNSRLSYSKSNPRILLHHSFYENVKHRFETTGHIGSFQRFLDAFS